MSQENTPSPVSSESEAKKPKVTPLRCLMGSMLSGSFAIALYSLTTAIAHSFATKPLISDKAIVMRLSSLVRTLVLGVASLGTFIFAFVAVGLILLAIQLILQGNSAKDSS